MLHINYMILDFLVFKNMFLDLLSKYSFVKINDTLLHDALLYNNFDFVYVNDLKLFTFVLWCLFASGIVFIGIVGTALNRKNILAVLVYLEILLLGNNLLFVGIFIFLERIEAQIFSLIVLSIAAGEAAIGLGLVIFVFRSCNTINICELNRLKN